MSEFTQTQLAALTAAISQGVTRVEYDGKTVTYGSIPEMLRLRDRMIRDVAARGDGIRPPVARPSVFIRR